MTELNEPDTGTQSSLDLDGLTSLLSRGETAEESVEDRAETEPSIEDAEPETEDEEEPEEAEPTEADEEEEAPAEVEDDLPHWLNATDKATLAKLPTDAKNWVLNQYRETKADYTRKTQEAAQIRKQAEEATQQQQQLREQYAKGVEILKSHIEAKMPKKPSKERWDPNSPNYNPDLGQREYFTWQEELQSMQVLAHQQQQIQAQQVAEQQRAAKEFIEAEAPKVLEIIPEWKDSSRRAKEIDAVKAYAEKTLGFTKEELNSVADSRNLLTLYKAFKYDQLKAQKPTIQAKAKEVKVVKPGAAGAVSSKTGIKSVKEEFNKRGDRDSLTALMVAMDKQARRK